MNPTSPGRAKAPLARPAKVILWYGAAAIVVAAAFALRLGLSTVVGSGLPPFIFFYPAVMTVAVLAGMGPGLFATAVAASATAAWVLPSLHDPASALPSDILALAVFVCMGVFMSIVAALFRRARQKAAEYSIELSARESQNRFSKVFHASPIGMTLTSIGNGRFLDVNEAFEGLSGFSRDQVLGKTTPELQMWIVPGDREAFLSVLGKEGTVRNMEIPQRRKSGETWTMLLSAEVIESAGEKIILGLMQDITERKLSERALQDSQRLLHTVIDLVPHFIFAKDRDSHHLLVNRACAEANGMTPQQMIGKRDIDLAAEPGQAEMFMRDDREVIDSGRPREIEELLTDAAGRTRILPTTKIPFTPPGTNIAALLGVAVDITELKHAQEEIQKLNAELEKRVTRRTAELQSANNDLEERTRQLALSEEWSRRIIDTVADGIVIVGTDDIIETINAAGAKILGWFPEELPGRDYLGLLPEPERSRVREVIEGSRSADPAARSGEAQETRALRKDGTTFPVEYVREEFITNGDRHAVISFRDVTERRKTEEALKLYAREVSDLYMNAPCGYHSLDSRGNFLRVNDTELRMLGYTVEEIVGRMNVRELLTPASRAIFAAAFPGFRKEGVLRNLELVFRRKDGTELPVLLSATAVRDDRGEFLISRSTIVDNTEKKRLVEQLQDAKQLAEEANVAKSSFLANMSHEIRTPMNAVIGFTNLALKTDLTLQQRDYLSKIHGAGVSLLGLINDILDFSKIEAGRLSIEQADFTLDSVIERLTALTGHVAFAKGLELLVTVPADVPALLTGDSHRLGQILTNLVGNSVKFTDAGEVEVTVTLLELMGQTVKLRFSVRDTGIGMTEEQASNLFQPFSQADSSTTRKFGGTGLGLSISRRLVELMGGQIWAKSAPGAGSTFTFTAWFGIGAGGQARRTLVPRRLDGMRVLVVDDNPAARESLHNVLTSLHFRVVTASSGEEAVRAVRASDDRDPFGLVLMDWRMPGMDGIEATRSLLGPPGLHNAPVVIVLSASGGGDDERLRALEAGAADFLIKPVTASTLVDAILRIFSPDLLPGLKSRTNGPGNTRRVQGVRILLVEDNEINQQIALELLRGEGAEVVLAQSGREAVETLERESSRFDLVLMDVQMPEMDGYEATRRVRSEPWGSRIPIIAMTAHALLEERRKALEAGMNDHISKPIDPEAMFATIGRYCKTRQSPVAEPPQPAPAGAAEPSVPPIAGVDIESALRRVSGNHRLFADLLSRFADGQEETPQKIASALEVGDKKLAERLAHTTKGTAGNLGVKEVEKSAAELEELIRRSSPPVAVEEARRRLAEVLAAAVVRIREALGTRMPPSAAQTTAGAGQLEAIAARLSALIADSDSAAVEYLEDEAAPLVAASSADEARRLRECLRAYDFSGAAEALRLIRARIDESDS